MTLVEFLLARIAEDEEAARRAAFGYGAGWENETDDVEEWSVVHASGKRDMVGCEDRDVTRHIARHDPARVLARCAADRRIVEEARDYSPELSSGDNGEWALDMVLRYLALPYDGHPDYRQEWKP